MEDYDEAVERWFNEQRYLPGSLSESERSDEYRNAGRHWLQYITKRGRRYSDCRFENYNVSEEQQVTVVAKLKQFCDTIDERIKGGKGIVLFGSKGTGKDHLLTAVVRVAIRVCGVSVRWTSGAELFGESRDIFSDRDKTERDFIREYTDPQVLVISDPTSVLEDKLTNYETKILYRIIDYRNNHLRPTWVTVNVASKSELEQRIGGKNSDRLIDGSLALFCNWPSYRSTAQV